MLGNLAPPPAQRASGGKYAPELVGHLWDILHSPSWAGSERKVPELEWQNIQLQDKLPCTSKLKQTLLGNQYVTDVG